MDNLFHENRPIRKVYIGGTCYQTGVNGIRDIIVYNEKGECGFVPWFAIFLNNEFSPIYRLNGKFVEYVEYE